MSCKECASWQRGVATIYGNGEVLTKLFDKPKCRELNGAETPEDFHCNRYSEGIDAQMEQQTKSGAPWENWYYDRCPDCSGAGSSRGETDNEGVAYTGTGRACTRCAGTSKVRYYDDGFIGEEQKRLHPVEVALQKQARQQKIREEIARLEAGLDPEPAVDPTKLNAVTRSDAMSGGGSVL